MKRRFILIVLMLILSFAITISGLWPNADFFLVYLVVQFCTLTTLTQLKIAKISKTLIGKIDWHKMSLGLIFMLLVFAGWGLLSLLIAKIFSARTIVTLASIVNAAILFHNSKYSIIIFVEPTSQSDDDTKPENNEDDEHESHS